MNKTLLESTETLFAKNIETMRKKNTDYAGSSDSMKNFQVTADLAHVPIEKGIMVRLSDKVTRIGNLLEREEMTGEVRDESLEDSLEDLINYAAILHYAIQRRKLAKKQDLSVKGVIVNFAKGITSIL